MTFGRAGAGLALGVALALDAGPACGDGIMLIEAGAFWMGSDSDDPNEAPAHRVYVRDFWIDRDKVTNVELARFLNAWGTKSPEGEDYFGRRARGPRRLQRPRRARGEPR